MADRVTVEHLDDAFSPPLRFVPIDEAAKDGVRQLVKNGSEYAAAQWTGQFWSYPLGPEQDEARYAREIDFEPTHYARA